ncbi:DUF7424 family protein [Salinivibrio sp. IB282]|uniref:DUF7424 family protein n=1 Tax=Salinivibrio sp. IB282 TaxID=1766122 RepID=UPI00098860FC|nr:hypothetical protein [Salinivibrio sp. IB282]OOE57264.1 hypothetical protein BZG14_15140 [Salinivibrio sp. IB282]
MKFILPMLVITAFLTGCKATVESEVSLKDILESKTKTISGNLYVEVASCNSYEDSRRLSNSVIEAQQTIPSIFADAKYIECFSKKFDSFAHFNIPVVLDKDKDGKMASDSHVNIISNSESLLTVGIPKSIKANMERVEENSFGASSFDLKVNIKVNNDTGKEFPFKVIAAYVEGQPYVYGDLTSKGDGAFVVTLSDVSVSRALENGTATVLLR